MLCIIALSCCFSGISVHGGGGWNAQRLFCSCGWIETVVLKNNTVNVAWIAKSVTEKNNSRVDCAEAGKKTMQAQRYEG